MKLTILLLAKKHTLEHMAVQTYQYWKLNENSSLKSLNNLIKLDL